MPDPPPPAPPAPPRRRAGRWMRFPELIGVLFVVAIGAIGIVGVQLQAARLAAALESTQATRAATLADMQHDALNAAVYQALYSAQSGTPPTLTAALRHAGEFVGRIESAAQLLTDPALRRTIDELQPKVRRFVADGVSIVQAAQHDLDAAQALLPGFQQQFVELERRLDALEGDIEAQAHANLAAARAAATLSNVGVLLTALLAALAAALLRRHAIRQQRRLELAQREIEAARDAAEQANRAKAAFLATMSHELRTPVHGVVGLAEMLRRGPLSQPQRQHAEALAEAGRALSGIVDEVLEFARIEAGHLELRAIDFDLRELVCHCVELMGAQALHRGLTLNLDFDPRLPAWVRGDPLRLRQVLAHLLGNAIKFTPSGEVRLEVAPDPALGPQGWRFVVADTGVGIDAATVQQLFRPFTQADASASRRFAGAGLGLVTASQLVQAMGGRIEVASTPGRGSVFSFTLRLQPAPPPALPAPPVDDAATKAVSASLSVLLVEDNPVNQIYAEAVLQSLGHRTVLAHDGEQALERLRDGTAFDVVLMDCMMPTMDGYEATRRLRAWEAERGAARLPVIAVTANALDENRARCRAAGMDGFVVKPFDPAQLAAALREHVGAPARAESLEFPDGAEVPPATREPREPSDRHGSGSAGP